MMFWLGKLLGSLFGYMIAGPFGAVFGLILGHYFDLSRKGHWFLLPPFKQHRTYTQDIFFRATFTIMGYIAKADGRVSENEIRVATRIMQNMMLTSSLRQQAIHYFQQGKQADFNLDQILMTLVNACHHRQNLLHLFIEIQVQAAYADGTISPKKQKILDYLCYKLNMNTGDFFQDTYRQEQAHYRNQNYRPTRETHSLEKAYRTLGASPSTTNHDLKKAYRKLMSQNHPDKLVSKGLPEEMIKLATQKTQEIKSAYETICKARGI